MARPDRPSACCCSCLSPWMTLLAIERTGSVPPPPRRANSAGDVRERWKLITKSDPAAGVVGAGSPSSTRHEQAGRLSSPAPENDADYSAAAHTDSLPSCKSHRLPCQRPPAGWSYAASFPVRSHVGRRKVQVSDDRAWRGRGRRVFRPGVDQGGRRWPPARHHFVGEGPTPRPRPGPYGSIAPIAQPMIPTMPCRSIGIHPAAGGSL